MCVVWLRNLSHEVLPMKPRFVALAFVAAAAGLTAVAAWPVNSEPHAMVAQIDFVALQRQADAALENLRRAQLRHHMPARSADGLYF
jgi:hypothetical protein